MQQGQDVKQQVVERIKQSTSILVAVASNPSVDALSAALGLSLMLNKLNKHTTAVFSGQVPPAIKFLEPSKTFENNVDALRDFIISLDKEKADRLRYKVEDNVVRIFITPYKTSITEKDLQYSQGDYNVDLIIALGVEKREELDQAIVSHGRILHDATVVTINANTQHSTLGVIDWNDGAASSLCEMLVSLSEGLQQPGVLDTQTSTALLTGIVAATERFSNTRTNPRVMTMAAQLMAAGANQQLIAANLSKAQEVTPALVTAPPVAKQPATAEPAPLEEAGPKKEPGELDITHTKPAQTDEAKKAEQELAAALPNVAAPATAAPQLDQLKKELDAAVKMETTAGRKPQTAAAPGSESVTMAEDQQKEEPSTTEEPHEYISGHGSWKGKRLEPPTLGGTLNATAEEALEDARKSEEEERNNMLFSHTEDRNANQQPQQPVVTPVPEQPAPVEVMPAPAQVVEPQLEPMPAPQPQPEPQPVIEPLPPQPPTPDLTPIPEPQQNVAMPQPVAPPMPAPQPAPELNVAPQPAPSASEAALIAQPADNIANNLNDARQAVSDAFASQPFNPANQPLQGVGAQEMPAMPNMPVSEPLSQAALQALPPAPAAAAPQPTNGMPPMPPMPGAATDLPPAPNLPGLNEPLAPLQAVPQPQQPPAPKANDPGQFKIPSV